MAEVQRLIASIMALATSGAALGAETDDIANWRQSPRAFLPADIETGVRTVTKGGTLFEAPLRWVNALRLQNDVTITFEGKSVTLNRGLQLPMANFRTKLYPDVARVAYCTRIGVVHAKSTFIRDVWLFKTPFNAKHKQLCLEDKDKDGTFETSFVKTDQHIMGRPDIIYAAPVRHPVAGEETLVPIDSSTDMLRYVIYGISKNKASSRIDITIQNNVINFDNLDTGGYTMRRWHTFKIGQGSQAILGFDIDLRSLDSVDQSAAFVLQRRRDSETPLLIPDNPMLVY